MYMYFGCFPSRKKKGAEMGWATAQLCHNIMGNCIVTQQVLGVQWLEKCIAIGELYCNMKELGW